MVVRRLLHSGYPIRAVLGVARRVAELGDQLDERAPVAPRYVTTPELMAEVIGFHLNRGVLASADRARFGVAGDLLAAADAVAVLEGVGDHENLGALFRNAAGLGIGAVLLGPDCADPLYRRSIRVSMGTVLQVPFATLAGEVTHALDQVRAAGFLVAALTPHPDAMPLAQAGLADRRVAVLLGSEGPGLTPAALAAADLQVRIPMASGVDSLNVATAAAITFAAVTGALR